ncbi:MAG: PDZ domain-containing protein [Nodularia sp. (in: Bacteria)]|nr:MAG: PDZ domain-containing protein [Nodularia sp. (in: cyanobacteria)]
MSEVPKNQIRFVDYYQTPLNAGTYKVTATLDAPETLKNASIYNSTTIKLHVAGPRFFLPPSEIHSVFPPENGAGDYNNVLPHVVLNRHTLPWERLVDGRNEDIPFLALLIFSDNEEANGDVTPPTAIELADLLIDLNFKYALEPGEKLTDKVNVIDVKSELLQKIIPTGKELCLLAHGRELHQGESVYPRAVVIANRLPAPPMFGIIPDVKQTSKEGVLVKSVQNGSVGEKAGLQNGDFVIKIGSSDVKNLNDITKAIRNYQSGNEVTFAIRRSEENLNLKATISDGDIKRRNIAHLVMLEKRFSDVTEESKFVADESALIRLVCLKSWQFNCTTDKPTLSGRLLSDFTFELFCVPEPKTGDAFKDIRLMSYVALPYHLRWGDRAHTLYHGPLVASAANHQTIDSVNEDGNLFAPASADGLVRLLKDHRIFDISLAAAWQLGQMLMLQDQSVAMEYFTWRRHDAQLRARKDAWETDGHLYLGDNFRNGLTPMPNNVTEWCQERLKLHGLPFEYLIPDARMLPENSLRIFRIHEAWMECLLSGALAIGRGGEVDRILEAEYRSIVYPESARGRTGFLLRSPAVDEHPDLKVVAEGATSEVRLERIGPGLLLGLYNGTFSKLEFSLPPIGLYFGFREGTDGFVKDVKNEQDGQKIDDGEVKATLRGERVVNISVLHDHISEKLQQKLLPSDLIPGSFAFQMCEGTEMVEFGVVGASKVT